MMTAEEHHDFIWDEDQVRRFEELVYDAESFKDGGCHVINLSVRKKYDRAGTLALSGQGMHIEHRILYEAGKLARTIKRYNAPVSAFVDDAGKPIPPYCMSVYSTLDNRSSFAGMKELTEEFQQHVFEIARTHNAKPPLFDGRRKLVSAISRSPLLRRFCQIDIDEKRPELYEAVTHQLREWGVKPTFTIETNGGFHIAVKYKDIPNKAQRDVRRIFEIVPGSYREGDRKQLVEFLDSTALIPIPGTRQGGFNVTLIDNYA